MIRTILHICLTAALLLGSTSVAAAQAATPAPFDSSAQAAALLPAFASDLNLAGTWHRISVDARLDPTSRTLAGTMQVEYAGGTPPEGRLVFRLYPNLREFGGSLQVTAISVDGTAVAPIRAPRADLLIVPVKAGQKPVVGMTFTAKAPLNASRKTYGAFNSENGLLSLASVLPTLGVVRGGAWDTSALDGKGDVVNSETALFDVTLTAPAGWKLATTGVQVSSTTQGTSTTMRAVSGPQRDFYIGAAQFRTLEADVDGTTVRLWVRNTTPNQEAALSYAVESLKIFNQQFGRYPLRELDVIAFDARTFYGVEYPGVVLIDHGLFSKPGLLETTIAHEVAHQWWYSQVGNDVQRESWVDEALASYAQVIYERERHGAEAANRELEQFRASYRRVRAAGRDAPIAQHNSAFGGNYSPVVYAKGALFIEALHQQMGDTAFAGFWKEYYAQNRYKYINGEALLASAERACGCEFDALYRSWVLRADPVQF